MKIIFNNSTVHQINPVTNSISTFVDRVFKHLEHVPVSFRYADNPFNITKEKTYKQLISAAEILNVDVDTARLSDQQYLNYLHNIYEICYDGKNTTWLDFHESIHLCENFKSDNAHNRNTVRIDFREQGGLLKQKFKEEYYKDSTLTVSKGDCFLVWAELAKTPYDYFYDNEVDVADRVLELCKPWIWLKPSFRIAIDDVDLSRDTNEMMNWFSKYKDDFCRLHNLKHWQPECMFSVIPFGKLNNVDFFINDLKNGFKPERISP